MRRSLLSLMFCSSAFCSVASIMYSTAASRSPPLGSPATVETMLEFCGRHGIAPVTETFPLAEVNAALRHVRDEKARYRAVLVVTGSADRVIPAAHAQAAPRGAKVQVMDGAGHMAMMEKASDFNALLKGHLAEC